MKLKDILLVVSVVALLFFAYSWNYAKKQAKEAQRKEQVRLVRNDSLRLIVEGTYTKLVADSLTKKQMQKVIEKLGIDLKNAILSQKIVFVPIDKKGEIKDIKVTDTTLTLLDYYPEKVNYFVKHTTTLKTKDTTATGEFNFNPITLSLGIAQQKNGTYKVITKLPEFFKINSLDIQALPLEPQYKKDVFGVLFGVDYVKPLDNNDNFDIDFNSYIRINKFYIGGGYRTDNSVKAGIKVEF
jgi:hypothetical protein